MLYRPISHNRGVSKGALASGISIGLVLAASVSGPAIAQDSATGTVAEIRHNNGSLISVNGELLDFASNFFPVKEGDRIAFGRGFTDFDLQIGDPSQVLWEVEVFPGDSLASFQVEDYVVDADSNFQSTTTLPSGQGNVIAYGFDPANPNPVVLTAVESEPEAVNEPFMGLALLLAAAIGYGLNRQQLFFR